MSPYYASVQTGWSYDAFGNRLSETQGKLAGTTPTASMPTSSSTTYTAASNQIATTTLASGLTNDVILSAAANATCFCKVPHVL
jgi:hypothetical protein